MQLLGRPGIWVALQVAEGQASEGCSFISVCVLHGRLEDAILAVCTVLLGEGTCSEWTPVMAGGSRTQRKQVR